MSCCPELVVYLSCNSEPMERWNKWVIANSRTSMQTAPTKVFEPLLQWKFAGPGTNTTRQGWIMCPRRLPRIARLLAASSTASPSSQQALLLRAIQGLCLFAKPPSLLFESLPNIFKHRNSECSATSKVPSTPQNYSSQAHHMSQAQKIPVIAVAWA